jgi:hypothetical protein
MWSGVVEYWPGDRPNLPRGGPRPGAGAAESRAEEEGAASMTHCMHAQHDGMMQCAQVGNDDGGVCG